jgi:hypothetical protein
MDRGLKGTSSRTPTRICLRTPATGATSEPASPPARPPGCLNRDNRAGAPRCWSTSDRTRDPRGAQPPTRLSPAQQSAGLRRGPRPHGTAALIRVGWPGASQPRPPDSTIRRSGLWRCCLSTNGAATPGTVAMLPGTRMRSDDGIRSATARETRASSGATAARSCVGRLLPPRERERRVSRWTPRHRDTSPGGAYGTLGAGGRRERRPYAGGVPVGVPVRTQHPLGVVVNRPSVWPDR